MSDIIRERPKPPQMLLRPPDKDALSGSARSCWGPTGWAGWAGWDRGPSWSWTWACEREGCGAQELEENHRRSSRGETMRPGPEPAEEQEEESESAPSWRPPSHRRSWCSRSPPLSETGLTHCCDCAETKDEADAATEAAFTVAFRTFDPRGLVHTFQHASHHTLEASMARGEGPARSRLTHSAAHYLQPFQILEKALKAHLSR